MTRGNVLTALAGLSGLGAATLAAVPAVAAPADGCGVAPDGASLERVGDICELEFSTPGDYDWTVPEGLTELYAVIVGGGGGAGWRGNEFFGEGYGGAGAEVRYLGIEEPAEGDEVEIVVGTGGESGSTAEPGTESSVTTELGTVSAAGGGPGFYDGHDCVIGDAVSFVPYVGNGNGAGGDAGQSGLLCTDTYAPGIVPASDDDSVGDEPLSMFADYTTELAAGGRVTAAADATSAPGQGANLLYTEVALTADARGADGLVVFRYAASPDGSDGGGGSHDGDGTDRGGAGDSGAGDADGATATSDDTLERLAATGADVGPIAALAAFLTALGLSAVWVTRRPGTTKGARRAD